MVVLGPRCDGTGLIGRMIANNFHDRIAIPFDVLRHNPQA